MNASASYACFRMARVNVFFGGEKSKKLSQKTWKMTTRLKVNKEENKMNKKKELNNKQKTKNFVHNNNKESIIKINKHGPKMGRQLAGNRNLSQKFSRDSKMRFFLYVS